jgi:hypothetical protein
VGYAFIGSNGDFSAAGCADSMGFDDSKAGDAVFECGREAQELWALMLMLPGILFFFNLFGCRLSLPSVGDR